MYLFQVCVLFLRESNRYLSCFGIAFLRVILLWGQWLGQKNRISFDTYWDCIGWKSFSLAEKTYLFVQQVFIKWQYLPRTILSTGNRGLKTDSFFSSWICSQDMTNSLMLQCYTICTVQVNLKSVKILKCSLPSKNNYLSQ